MVYLSFLLSVCLVCFLHLGQCFLSSSLSGVLVLFLSVRKLNLLHSEHFKPVICLGPFFAMRELYNKTYFCVYGIISYGKRRYSK